MKMKKGHSSHSSNKVVEAVDVAVDVAVHVEVDVGAMMEGAVIDASQEAVDNSKSFEEMSLEELRVRKDFLTWQSANIGREITVIIEHITQ
jgi:hypothetical protein